MPCGVIVTAIPRSRARLQVDEVESDAVAREQHEPVDPLEAGVVTGAEKW